MSGWLLSSTVLVSVVLILRRLLRRHLHPTVIYALWLLAAIRLLVPVQIGVSDISLDRAASSLPLVRQADTLLPSDTGNAPSPAAANIAPVQDTTPTEGDTAAKATVTIAWPRAIAAVWIGGSALTLAWFLAVNGRCYGRLRRSRRPLDAGGELPVYVSAAIETPCLFGRGIYVTPEVAADAAALRHVLAHEATHYRHGDPLWALVRGACLVVHWWNPLVWLVAIRSREDSELACDACAVKQLDSTERAAYGKTLIALSCGKAAPSSVLTAATTMSGGKRTLKERVRLLAKRPRTRVVAACVLAAAVILAAVAGFSSYRAAIVSKGIDQLTCHALLKPGKGISSVELCGQWYHDGVLVGQLPMGSARLPLRLDVAMEGASRFEDGVMTIAPLDELKKCLPADDEAACSYVSSGPLTSGSIPVTAGELYCVGFAARSDAAEGLVVPLPEEITADPARLTSLSCDVYVVWACFSDDGTDSRFADPALAKELGRALFRPGSWYAQALTSTYDDPRDVDLFQMFYNGGSRQPSQEEYDYVQYRLGDPGTDVMVISRQEMDEALTEVFGLTLEETHKKNLAQFIYREETDCYYLCHGDTNVMSVDITSGLSLGDGRMSLSYTGWDGGLYTVTVELPDGISGEYRISSHVKIS